MTPFGGRNDRPKKPTFHHAKPQPGGRETHDGGPHPQDCHDAAVEAPGDEEAVMEM